MRKKDALTVAQLLDAMEQQPYLNSDFNVYSVSGHLSGKPGITVSAGASTGSGYGLPRAIPSGGCANFLATVLPHSMALRITGLNRYPRNKSTIPEFSIVTSKMRANYQHNLTIMPAMTISLVFSDSLK